MTIKHIHIESEINIFLRIHKPVLLSIAGKNEKELNIQELIEKCSTKLLTVSEVDSIEIIHQLHVWLSDNLPISFKFGLLEDIKAVGKSYIQVGQKEILKLWCGIQIKIMQAKQEYLKKCAEVLKEQAESASILFRDHELNVIELQSIIN